VSLTPAAEAELEASRGPGGSLLAYLLLTLTTNKAEESAKVAKAQKEEAAAQSWQSLLSLPRLKRSVAYSNTIRFNIEYNHRHRGARSTNELYWHCGITEWDFQLQDWKENGLVKEMETHDPMTFKLPNTPQARQKIYERLSIGDWSNVDDWQFFGGQVKNGKWFPVWNFLTPAQQTQIKADVLHTNHIPYANDYATHWTVATMRQQ
ncbi:hypothetical protein CYMTET_16133, partial [Cymbomonas tetramitiformis]